MAGRDAESRIRALAEAHLPRVLSQLVAGLCIPRLCELGCDDCRAPLVHASEFMENYEGYHRYVGSMVIEQAETMCPERAAGLQALLQDIPADEDVGPG